MLETLEAPESMNPDVLVEKEEIKDYIIDAIRKLPDKEKKVIVLYYYEDLTLKEIGVYQYFDLIVTGDDVKEFKPSREGIDMFIDKFNLDRNRVLMIGDAPADVIAAHSACVKAASVLWDSYAKERVMQMNSDYLFETVQEFKLFLENNI